jgi:Family of unknown function (DUF5808)
MTLFILALLISSVLIIAAFGRKKRNRTYNIALLLIGDVLLVVSWLFLYPFPAYSLAIPIILFGILNLFAIRKIFGPENPNQEILNAWHDDPANWRTGVFYYNPQDKRIFPPKRIEGMGWTINFANTYSILVLLGILILAVAIAYIAAINGSK